MAENNKFNEATRVQMPALVHLTRLGYQYYGKISDNMADTLYDPDTNILIDVFKQQFCSLNPEHEGEVEQVLRTIRQELDNDDLGRSFYKRPTLVSTVRLIDFEHPEKNTNLNFNTPTNRILTSMCSPDRLLFMLKYGIAYVKMEREVDGKIESTDQKHIMRYQQLFAALTVRPKLSEGETSGVIWHTQGSGKTALSYCLKNLRSGRTLKR